MNAEETRIAAAACCSALFGGASTDFLEINEFLDPDHVAGPVSGTMLRHHLQGELVQVGAICGKADDDTPRL
ncbi:MAG: hypothetical protein HYS13_18050 [Planctomycetia bacterium]|nr:hypothetical protein [Planctomycetia bacterium]